MVVQEAVQTNYFLNGTSWTIRKRQSQRPLIFKRKFQEMLCHLWIIDNNNDKWIVKNVTLQQSWHHVWAFSLCLQWKKNQKQESNLYFKQWIEKEVKTTTFAWPQAMTTTRQRKIRFPYPQLSLLSQKKPACKEMAWHMYGHVCTSWQRQLSALRKN